MGEHGWLAGLRGRIAPIVQGLRRRRAALAAAVGVLGMLGVYGAPSSASVAKRHGRPAAARSGAAARRIHRRGNPSLVSRSHRGRPARRLRHRHRTARLHFASDPTGPFTSIESGFTQALFGVNSGFIGGVAFAPNGDVWTDDCAFDGSPLHRFAQGSTTVVNSTTIHTETTVSSNAGCGLTNGADGSLYSNTSSGINKLDPNTGAYVATLGQPGNALGIAPDPQTGNLVYPAADCRFTATCTILSLDPATNTVSTFAVLPGSEASFVDGVAFDPTGNFLFVSNRAPLFQLTVLNRSGAVVQNVPMSSEPDGIAFHTADPQFVVTNDTDGTITRFTFPNNDFTQAPTVSNFAAGGFRGDLSQVGPDGCLYVTQDGTRYADGTVTGENSIVQICPGFAPPPGVGPQTSCAQAGQMVSNTPLSYDQWHLQYGVSKCEGLVISNVSLRSRLMAERMSLPYLDLQTCTGQSGGIPSSVSGCAVNQLRHITLVPSGDETQQDPSLYTHVELLSPGVSVTDVPAASYSPCNGLPGCDHVAISATYRVSLSPPTGTSADQYLLVTQKYEFYKDFSEKKYPQLACEPSVALSSFPVIGGFVSPLDDCGRWKPLVSYQYHMGSSNQILVSLNAAERLHFTPDATAVRAATFARDCDNGAPSTGCSFSPPPGSGLEVFPPTGAQNPIQKESVIRAVQATDSGVVGNDAGRYDNLHQTEAKSVQLPQFPSLPPGCAECVHIHWRWGTDISNLAANSGFGQFGGGQPLLGDGEPAAGGNAVSRQQLDVGLVAYHSTELSPLNFMQLVQGANPSALDMHGSTSSSFSGGWTQGTETLFYPPGSCFAAFAPASWGQCGDVTWLSATSFAQNVDSAGVGDEDSDTFFAFGGFFCGHCDNATQNQQVAKELHPTYGPNILHSNPPKAGQAFSVSFLQNTTQAEIYDVLPAGMTNVTVTINQPPQPVPLPPPQPNGITCDPVSIDSNGSPVVHCSVPSLAQTLCVGGPCIVINGNLPSTPGDYRNIVHAAWGSATDNNGDYGGNLRLIDPFTVS